MSRDLVALLENLPELPELEPRLSEWHRYTKRQRAKRLRQTSAWKKLQRKTNPKYCAKENLRCKLWAINLTDAQHETQKRKHNDRRKTAKRRAQINAYQKAWRKKNKAHCNAYQQARRAKLQKA